MVHLHVFNKYIAMPLFRSCKYLFMKVVSIPFNKLDINTIKTSTVLE